ncbi:MAG: MCE family protein [Sciscionella sp.]
MGTTVWASTKRRLLGLLLVVLVLAFLVLTLAIYNKDFTKIVSVQLRTDSVGSQLLPQADVKVRGILVGEVRTIKADPAGATLQLAIQPAKAPEIPANTKAQLLPKSLFGERYVALQVPKNSTGPTLHNGDVLTQDHSKAATEVGTAINDLLPVLQAVQPQKISETLTAVATALQGRGPKLGRTVTQLSHYIGALNPQLPTLEHDLKALVGVSHTYSDALPDLSNALQELTTTTKTIAQQRANLRGLYSTVTQTSGNLQNFLQANESNLIRLGPSMKPTLQVLARYSPEYPCFLKGISSLIPAANKAFGKGTNEPGLHATVEVTVNRGPYKPGVDTPNLQENRGPRCFDFKNPPDPFPQYAPDGPLNDGTTHPPAARTVNNGVLPAGNAPGLPAGTSPQSAIKPMGLPNSPQEAGLVEGLVGTQLGVAPSDIPSWATGLYGPLYRGTEVVAK